MHTAWAEPEKQFALVERHISRLRKVRELVYSQIIIMVERNLGFEAEHHQRALHGMPHTRFRIDHAAQRYGILTTEGEHVEEWQWEQLISKKLSGVGAHTP